jgi:lipopolysaccharide biosynthesis regulator YciM
MPELKQMVYVSFSEKDLSENDLEDFLTEIREKNKRQEVTGMLLYNEGSFIQVVEGGKDTIDALFKKLKNDPRHNTIVVLLDETINERSFPNWTMGYHKMTTKQAGRINGFSDFMNSEERRIELKKSTPDIIYLLNSFKEFS